MMYVCLKQSGELLTETGAVWTPEALKKSAASIKHLYQNAGRLGVEGLLMVSGGGNIARGRDFKPDKVTPELARNADPIARWGTVSNTLFLAAAVRDADVPTAVFTAQGMTMTDPTLGRLPEYDRTEVQDAYSRNKVVFIGGGTGADGCTTDAAVAWYAIDQARDGHRVSALKATNVDGVYYGDPRKNPGAPFYPRIAAADMLADYANFGVVDQPSLEALATASADLRVDLQIFNGTRYGAAEVLEARQAGTIVGSLVLPGLMAETRR